MSLSNIVMVAVHTPVDYNPCLVNLSPVKIEILDHNRNAKGSMQQYLKVCEQAAKAGGGILLEWMDRIRVTEKGPGDLVTEADFESQRVIRDMLLAAFPEHAFQGEEELDDDDHQPTMQDASYRWVVDPLDGTTNYVHGMPTFAVSVALVRGSEPLVGVVYEPVAERCFRAVRDRGAFLNDSPIRVSSCDNLSQALVGASLPAFVPDNSVDLRRFNEVVGGCQAIRRIGSAALNLSYVAAGWLDGYYAQCVKPWDVAAGVLLVREAGGKITSMEGGSFCLDNPHFVCAGTGSLHSELSARLARVE